jgi:hypothetical protein
VRAREYAFFNPVEAKLGRRVMATRAYLLAIITSLLSPI